MEVNWKTFVFAIANCTVIYLLKVYYFYLKIGYFRARRIQSAVSDRPYVESLSRIKNDFRMRRNQITLTNTFRDYRKSYSEIAKYQVHELPIRRNKIAILNHYDFLNYLLNNTIFILDFITEFVQMNITRK